MTACSLSSPQTLPQVEQQAASISACSSAPAPSAVTMALCWDRTRHPGLVPNLGAFSRRWAAGARHLAFSLTSGGSAARPPAASALAALSRAQASRRAIPTRPESARQRRAVFGRKQPRLVSRGEAVVTVPRRTNLRSRTHRRVEFTNNMFTGSKCAVIFPAVVFFVTRVRNGTRQS